MSRWWRAYDEAVNDPKLQLLSDAMFRAWFNVLCIASRHEGRLPAIEVVAYLLHMKVDKAAEVITKLHRAGLLDKDDNGFYPHNWNGRQYKSDVTDATGASRSKRYRDRKRDASRVTTVTQTVSVTPPREQRTETEKKSSLREERAPRASRLPDDWIPSAIDRAFAQNRGLSEDRIDEEALKFRNYWTAKGKDAAKVSWPRTWENWIINTGGGSANRTANPRTTGQSAFLAAATRKAEQFIRQDAMAGRADPLESAERSRPDGSGASGFAGPLRGAGDGAGGFEFDGGGIIEGEVSPRDEARGRFSDGSDVGFSSRRSA